MIEADVRGDFGEVLRRLRPYVARRVSSPTDADDVLQEISLRMHRGLADLEDDERFGPWVYRLAKHAIADHFRMRARHPLTREATLGAASFEPEDAGALDEKLQAELAQCVALFVAKLPSPYREALTLTELEGLTQREASELLGVSLSGMKSRVQRGRERIRGMFEACCELSVDARGHVTSCVSRSLDDVPADCRDAALSWTLRSEG